MARKKFFKGSIMLALNFAVITICLCLIVQSMRESAKNQLSSNALYSGNQQEFTIVATPDGTVWDKILPAMVEQDDNFILYLPMESTDMVVRGIYTSGKNQVPPMIRGTFFDSNTSWSAEKSIVVGKDLIKGIYEQNGKEYYDYGGDTFHVIGVMGLSKESRINRMLLVDFRSAVNTVGVATKYVIDGKNKKVIDAAIKQFEDVIGADVDVVMPETTFDETSLLSGGSIMTVISVFMMISFFLCLILVTGIWFKFRENLRYVWEICGYKKCWQRLELIKMYGITALLGITAGVICYVLI